MVQKDPVLSFEAIGTLWTIEIFGVVDLSIEKLVQKRIAAFDKNYSRFRADSLVTQMSQKKGTYVLPADARPMMDLYQNLYTVTNGLVTPLIGQTISDAGYDAAYSFVPKKLRKTPTWKDAMEYNFPHIVIKQPVLLDFGAMGKGYLVDTVAELLRENGVEEFIINAGGDIVCRGSVLADIALENPDNMTQAVGVARLQNQALCGSAGNRRKWHGFSHIMNPLFPTAPETYKAVWVQAKTTMLADAITTALYFCPAQLLSKQFNFEYAMINRDGSLIFSPDFSATFFNNEMA